MKELLNTPLFGVLISLITYEIGVHIYQKTKLAFLNPLLISIALIIAFLSLFKIDIKSYASGGNIITFFLGPSTVLLAVPLYKQLNLLKKYLVPVLVGITVGSATSIISVYYLAKLFGLTGPIAISLIPKSITTAIGVELSKQIGGIPSISVVAIILTGITGAIISPYVCKFFKINDSVAKGVAIGTSSHAVGTSKAVELGEVEGAMSGLAIGIAGLITVFIAPLLLRILNSL